jgi:gamma-glutamyltranspeptidase / glutathione hydrolase
MVALKRYHQQYLPDKVVYEAGAFSNKNIASLLARGHALTETKRPFGNMNVVTWRYLDGKIDAATDPRGEGEGRVY